MVKYAARSQNMTQSDVVEWYESGADAEKFVRMLMELLKENVIKNDDDCPKCYLREMLDACYTS